MKPVEYRKPPDASVEKNAPQPGTAVGKRRQHCALGPPDRIEAAADQAYEIRVGLRHGAEDLPPAGCRLDIADPNLQLPLAGLATPNEGRIQGHHNRLGAGRRRLYSHLRWERLGDLERVTAKGLRIRAGVHRKHLPQHLGGRPIGHQGGELRPQPIQLRGRADMQRPPQACLGHAASNTAVAGQPDGDLAEQRGDRVLTIILDPADRATAAAARRTARGVPPRLRRDELLLDASQELLTLRQGQAQDSQIREVVRSGDLHDLRAAFVARGPDAYQLHDPGHAVSAHRSTSRNVPSWTRTPNLAAVPFRPLEPSVLE